MRKIAHAAGCKTVFRRYKYKSPDVKSLFRIVMVGVMTWDGKITNVQRKLACFLRNYRHESYREITNECGISKSSVAGICLIIIIIVRKLRLILLAEAEDHTN